MPPFKQRFINVIYWFLIAIVAFFVSAGVRHITCGAAAAPQRFPSDDDLVNTSLRVGYFVTFMGIVQYLITGEIHNLLGQGSCKGVGEIVIQDVRLRDA